MTRDPDASRAADAVDPANAVSGFVVHPNCSDKGSGPASDAPAPPRETASSLASRVEEWVARQCTVRHCPMDHKFWDEVVARLRAASPAQEATPPRCPSEGPEGQPCGRTPGHFGRHACSHDGNERLWDDSTARAAPTPEASAPREDVTEFPCVNCGRHHRVEGGIARPDWPSCFNYQPAAPAREASSAPGEEAETEQYRQIALHLNDTRLNMEPVSVNQVRHIARSLRATVAALTAERTRLQQRVHQQDLAETTNDQRREPVPKEEG